MFFNKKDSVQNTGGSAPPPPWENIDKSLAKKFVSTRAPFNLTEFVSSVTGFGRIGAKILLLGLAVALGFLSYAFYLSSKQVKSLPPQVDRPAIEIQATTTAPVTPVTGTSTILQ